MAATKTKLPPNPLISEVLDAVSKARSKVKKIEILKKNISFGFSMALSLVVMVSLFLILASLLKKFGIEVL